MYKNTKKDVLAEVNEKFLSLMEKGVKPWERDWICRHTYNIVSQNDYSLLNRLILPKAGAYASFKQWQELGGKIIKGEKSSHVYFYKIKVVGEKKDGESENAKTKSGEGETLKTYPILKCYPVFHIDQVEWPDGMPAEVESLLADKDNEKFELSQNEKDIVAEAIIRAYTSKYNIKIKEDKDPCYSPYTDTVHCWGINCFKTVEGYYATLFHELGHSTGHPSRLNRNFSGRFGSKSYAREELVAEITAGYINTLLGLETENTMENHASYIQGWKNVIANDKRAFVVAANKAEKAIDCLLCGKDVSDYVNENRKPEFSVLESLNLEPLRVIPHTPVKRIEFKEAKAKATSLVHEQVSLFSEEEINPIEDKEKAIAEKYQAMKYQEKIDTLAKTFGATTGVIKTSPCYKDWRGTSDVHIVFDNDEKLFLGNQMTRESKTKRWQNAKLNEFLLSYNPEIVKLKKEYAFSELKKMEKVDNETAKEKGVHTYEVKSVDLVNKGDYLGWYYVNLTVNGKEVKHLDTGSSYSVDKGDFKRAETYREAGGVEKDNVKYVFNNYGYSYDMYCLN